MQFQKVPNPEAVTQEPSTHFEVDATREAHKARRLALTAGSYGRPRPVAQGINALACEADASAE